MMTPLSKLEMGDTMQESTEAAARARGPVRTRAWRITGGALIALVLAGCDLDLVNPTVLSVDDVDPQLLVNGAIESWMTGWNSGVISEWYASDEAIATPSTSSASRALDETGDLTGNSTYFSGFAFAELLDAREETRIAVQRAEAQLAAAADAAQTSRAVTALQRAKAYNAWFVSGLARRRGAQPISPHGETLTQEEQYLHALDQFSDVIEISEALSDSMRINALAGTARLQWTLGREAADAQRLNAAIDAAEEALSRSPNYSWAFAWPFGYITDWYITRFRIAAPAPEYADIPIPANVTTTPGDMFVDADALWLIIADSHLQLGALDDAKAALASTPLLLTNHVGVAGRDPEGAPMTAAEAEAWVQPLTAAEVQEAIDELWRENFYLRGDRGVSNSGTAIFPIPLPPNALVQP